MTPPRRKDGWLRYRADLRTLTAMQHPLRSDCKPVILGFLPPDEDWIPDTFEMAPDISIGATGT